MFGFKSEIKRIISFFDSKAIILAYHRVANLKTDPQLLAVSLDKFEAQLRFLNKNYKIISLLDLYKDLEHKKIRDKSVVLTFDDGYLDNYLNLKPILEKYKIPATIFITTDFIGKKVEFWWDELDKILFLATKMPFKITLNIDDFIYEWGFESDSFIDFDWNVNNKNIKNGRIEIYRDLHRLLRVLSLDKTYKVLDDLKKQLGLYDFCRDLYQVVDINQLKDLSDSKYIEIGSHSKTHPVLSARSYEEQKLEIFKSKEALQNIIGKNIKSFSYPFGGLNDIGFYSPDLVKDAGYDLAVANFYGIVKYNTNKHVMPRFIVRDWDLDLFASKIRKFFNEK